MFAVAAHRERVSLWGRPGRDRVLRWATAGPERGSILISAIWTIPFALALFAVGIQMVMWFWCRDQALQAAQMDLTITRSYQGSGDGQAQAQAYLADQSSTAAWLGNPSITTDRGAAVTTVTVTGTTKSILPVLPLRVHLTVSGATETTTAPGAGAP